MDSPLHTQAIREMEDAMRKAKRQEYYESLTYYGTMPPKQAAKKANLVWGEKGETFKGHKKTDNKRYTKEEANRMLYKNGKAKRNGRRSFKKNGLAAFQPALKAGAIAGAGFFGHKILSNVISESIMSQMFSANEGGTPSTMQKYQKPISGLVTAAIGIPVAAMVLPGQKTEIGAGMVASALQQIVMAMFSDSPDTLNYLSGYQNSRAYQLQGTQSIGPRYTPVNATGEYFSANGMGSLEAYRDGSLGQIYQASAGFEQAAAGYSQAAAGYSQAAAGMGEYFAQKEATGEYFADSNLQGIGEYEQAGELTMVNDHKRIDDGIRPDANLDHIMDLTDAVSGVNGMTLSDVNNKNTWIPSGPFSAGERRVTATLDSSQAKAGTLYSPGGNGILSQ